MKIGVEYVVEYVVATDEPGKTRNVVEYMVAADGTGKRKVLVDYVVVTDGTDKTKIVVEYVEVPTIDGTKDMPEGMIPEIGSAVMTKTLPHVMMIVDM